MDNTKHKIPRNVLGLYIKLFCKKRRLTNKSSKILMEACRSWASLSETEKFEFIKKYEECKSLLNNKFANYLKKAKPYMKKKQELLETTVKLSDDFEYSNKLPELNLNKDENLPQATVTADSDLKSNDCNPTDDHICNDFELTDDNMHTVIMSEPSPPILLSGKELFEMLKKEDMNKTWSELPKQQKRQYQSAILTIKKNYLKQYQQYLESLPSVQLIEHYKSLRSDLI